jgi:hypothetical protein
VEGIKGQIVKSGATRNCHTENPLNIEAILILYKNMGEKMVQKEGNSGRKGLRVILVTVICGKRIGYS